jgi:superfamily I DNA/RNA helicase
VSPGVHLLNAHTGKGQQFDWAFVPGLEEKHLPDRRSTTGSLLAEEERVLLVMLSRARHGIIVHDVKNNGRPIRPLRCDHQQMVGCPGRIGRHGHTGLAGSP